MFRNQVVSRLLLSILIVFIYLSGLAQDPTPTERIEPSASSLFEEPLKASLYVSANYGLFPEQSGGYGMFPNALLNYEVFLGRSRNKQVQHYVDFIAGPGVAEIRETSFGWGILYTRLKTRGNHNLEFSAGGHSLLKGINPIVNLGYRYQNPNGGMMFKIYAATVGVGAGIGWRFNSIVRNAGTSVRNNAYDAIGNKNKMAKKTLYVSGSAAIFSTVLMNVEFWLGTTEYNKRTLNHYFRINSGQATVAFDDGDSAFGVAYTALFGTGARHLEISAGTNIAAEACDCFSPVIVPIMDVGYRYQKPMGGLMYRIYVANVGVGFGIGAAF